MSNPRTISPSTDPLAETLHLLRLTGSFYCRSELTAPWGIELPAFPGCMMFHIVTAGEYWLEIEGADPILLQKGSLALAPHGEGHCIRSALETKVEPLFDIEVERVSERYEVLRHGGGGDFTHMICVVMQFDHAAAERLVGQLPLVMHLNKSDIDEDAWLLSTINFISREARELRAGGETVITRLADILVIQMIRSWIDTAPEAGEGWLAALRDEQVGQALVSIHREPQRNWSVAGLASECNMSRSAFSARFTNLVGESVLRYLTSWRMQLARTHLRDTNEPLSMVAERVGYESEAAFCRAFKRAFNVTPGSLRRGIPKTTTSSTPMT